MRQGSKVVSAAGAMMGNHLWYHFSLQILVCRRLLHHAHYPRSPGGLATCFAERPFDGRRKNVMVH